MNRLRNIIFITISTLVIINTFSIVNVWALDAEVNGTIYGDSAGLARVEVLEGELHSMTIRFDHPRIFVNNDTLATYQARVAANHPNWAGVRSRADGGDMINAAFAYLMLKNSNLAQATIYANTAIQAIKNNNPPVWSSASTNERKTIGKMALAFDWVYNAMSADDKTTLTNKLANLTEIASRASSIRGGYKESGETFHREEWIFYTWRAWPEIALANHATDADFLYKSRWNYNWYWGDAARMYAYVADGSPFEGYDSGADGLGWFLALKSATGINLVDGENYPWARETVYHNLYRFDLGMGREIFHHGASRGVAGCESYTTDATWKRRTFLGQNFPLAATKDPYAQWILINAARGASSWPITIDYYTSMSEVSDLAKILFYDPYAVSTDPRTATYDDLPFSKYFPGGNEVYMRSGWGGDDAIAGFRTSPVYTKTSHGDFDANTFVLYRKGVLSPDSGFYDVYSGQSNYFGYQKNTTAHNNMLIIDPSNPNGPIKLSNKPDPGGTERVSTRTFGAPSSFSNSVFLHRKEAHWGDITNFETTPDYDYAVGEAAAAYGTRLSKYERSVVFIRKGTKAYFIVFDDIKSTSANYKKKWLMHTVTEPIVNGTRISQEIVGHIDTYNGDLTKSENAFGTSALYNKTLLPAKHSIRRVGGEGYEFYVEGSSPRNFSVSDSDKNTENWSGGPWQEAGTWRIEIMPDVAAQQDYFFNVMYLTDKGDFMPDTVAVDAVSVNMTGAYIAADKNTPSWIVMFNKTEGQVDTSSNIIYNLSGEGNSKHLIADLKPNIEFTITNRNLDNNTQTTLDKTSSDQGTLYFETNLGSKHQIVISEKGSTPSPLIALTLSADKNEVQPGDIITYTLTYQNTSSVEAKNIVLTDPIPQGTTYVSGSATNSGIYDAGNNRITWAIPTLAAGATGAVSFKAVVE